MEVLIILYLAVFMTLGAHVALLCTGKDLGILPTVIMVALDFATLAILWVFFETINHSMSDYKQFIAAGFMIGTIARVIYVVRLTLS